MKRIIIHIGPHKTGSTSIQRMLQANKALLARRGIAVVMDTQTHTLAHSLAGGAYEAARTQLAALAERINALEVGTVILSQEDFSGDLIGRKAEGGVYPQLTRHIRLMRNAFTGNQLRFLFFRRDEEDWLPSAYAQHLLYRQRFASFESFRAAVPADFNWDKVIEGAQALNRRQFVVLPYTRAPLDGISRLLGFAGLRSLPEDFDTSGQNSNPSPDPLFLADLERIQAHSDDRKLLPIYKERLRRLHQLGQDAAISTGRDFTSWPPMPQAPAPGLKALSERVAGRIARSDDVPDLLPPADVDLRVLGLQVLPRDLTPPDLSRADMRDQAEILRYHFRGRTELAWLNALVISHLRRDTDHTARARVLFHRIWEEQGIFLAAELTTRWLISTLQTFLDHGRNAEQRMIGASGYFYANMMKIYEGERAIEGLEANATYDQDMAQTRRGFRGMDRYTLGGTDLLLNTNALALEIAGRDPVAGLVLEEFLLRVKNSPNVFSRNDQSRAKLGADVPNFTDTWSFFEPKDWTPAAEPALATPPVAAPEGEPAPEPEVRSDPQSANPG